MHTLGLEGMPRRIVTYPGGFGEEGSGGTPPPPPAGSRSRKVLMLRLSIPIGARCRRPDPEPSMIVSNNSTKRLLSVCSERKPPQGALQDGKRTASSIW
jgi:hypothetical protein